MRQLLWMMCISVAAVQVLGQTAAIPRSRVYVDGKLIPSGHVIMKEGSTYIEASALADAIGATLRPGKSVVMMTTMRPNTECANTSMEGRRFSDDFRSEVISLADEIESLRAVAMKNEKEKIQLGPRFDELDRRLTLSKAHVNTEADSAVYYALSFASNSLAIAYYKRLRDSPVDQKEQLESMICAMESKFAVMKGVLLPGGSCIVFQRMESQSVQSTQKKAGSPE